MPEDQPELSPQPSTRSKIVHKLKRHKYVLAGVAIAAIAAVLSLVIAMGNGSSPKKPSSESPFVSVLTQKETLLVGDKRYVAPCQALPISYVADNFGLSDSSTIQEDTLSTSVAAKTQPAEAHCLYLLDSKKIKEIDVYTQQYADVTDMQRIGYIYFVEPEEVDSKLAELKSGLGANASQASKDFVATIEGSLASYRKYAKEYRPENLKDFSPNGFILPTGAREYTAIFNNVAYRLSMQYHKDSMPSVATQVANWQKTFATIKKNANNKQLSQAPAPTLLRKKTTAGQSTKIIEPCTVLGSAQFKEITGVDQNSSLSRRTMPHNVDAKRYGTVDKQLIIPSNTCQRTYDNDDTETKITVDFEIKHAATVDQAKKWYSAFATGPGDIALQTTADEAVQSVNEFTPESPLYGFRVGPYIVILDIQTIDSSGSGRVQIVTATQEQHIKAINTLTAQLKQQL